MPGTKATTGKSWEDKFDAVALNSIYTETFKKEQHNYKLKEEYTTHPGRSRFYKLGV